MFVCFLLIVDTLEKVTATAQLYYCEIPENQKSTCFDSNLDNKKHPPWFENGNKADVLVIKSCPTRLLKSFVTSTWYLLFFFFVISFWRNRYYIPILFWKKRYFRGKYTLGGGPTHLILLDIKPHRDLSSRT